MMLNRKTNLKVQMKKENNGNNSFEENAEKL